MVNWRKIHLKLDFLQEIGNFHYEFIADLVHDSPWIGSKFLTILRFEVMCMCICVGNFDCKIIETRPTFWPFSDLFFCYIFQYAFLQFSFIGEGLGRWCALMEIFPALFLVILKYPRKRCFEKDTLEKMLQEGHSG